MPARITPSETHPSSWSGSFATIRDLEILHAVIEVKKTTTAAAQLGISQPAVSRALAQMEARSGRILFRREGMLLAPTADALALYEETKTIFTVLARLRTFTWSQASTKPLRVAAPPTIAHCLLESLIARFLEGSPLASISLEIATTPAVLELVADHRADLALADVISPASALPRVPFRAGSFVCAVHEGHALAANASVKMQDLHELDMVLLVKRNPVRALIDRLCTKAGVKPRVRVETANALSAVRLAAEGVGATLVNPFPVAHGPATGVRFIPFEPALRFETAFFLPTEGPVQAETQRFLEFVRAHLPPDDALSQTVG